jgi:5'(3')-deoxyribonucleotidase
MSDKITISKSMLKDILDTCNIENLYSAEDCQSACEHVYDLLAEEFPFLLEELNDDE